MPHSPTALASTAMKQILVVEDEHHLAIGIKYNLEAEGYHVTVVGDGPAALEAIEQQGEHLNLVILDLMLPGMSGYTVCQTLREAGNPVPVLMLSARTLTEDRIRGYDVGADQYLQKPFDLEELLSMVRNLLARRQALPAQPSRLSTEVYEFGQGKRRVNFDTFEVTVGGEPRKLTTLQMKLLRYFVENEGSVVGRGELLEHVWGMSHQPSTRTVDNFLLDLRKCFEDDPARPKHFLSVRGAGYRFVAEPEEGGEPGAGSEE
ncbi:MAG: response regulator transcription factor [Pirellulales bacterium]